MSAAAGTWTCRVDTPMGEQAFTLIIAVNGDSFTGRAEGGLGAMDVEGDVSGDTIEWAMRVTKPMPITLNCSATASGDTIEGKLSAGIFGKFALKGDRA